jgi:hypothetical protein
LIWRNKGSVALDHIGKNLFLTVAVVLAMGISGCGVTKLWGGDSKSSLQGDQTLREQASTVSEPMWEVESKGSWFGRIAGVLISGKEEADTATAAFELTGNEDETVQQAANYLKDRAEGAKDLTEIAKRVGVDVGQKSEQVEGFLVGVEEALVAAKEAFNAAQATDGGEQKAALKKADDDRRVVSRTAKAIKQQLEVFVAARDLIVEQEPETQVKSLNKEISTLEGLNAKLTGLADQFDFKGTP